MGRSDSAHSRHAGQPGEKAFAGHAGQLEEDQLRTWWKGAGRRQTAAVWECGAEKIISKICLLGTHYAYRMSGV